MVVSATSSAEHRRFLLSWSAAVIALAAVPLCFGYLHQSQAGEFTGVTYNTGDFNQYLTWIEQSRRGQWLFSDAYTLEPHRPVFFHPLLLILGKVAALTGLSSIACYHLEQLLGAMLLSEHAVSAAATIVQADDFYKPAHRHVFDAIQALYAAGRGVDPLTVAEELDRVGLLESVGGAATLVSLQAATPLSAPQPFFLSSSIIVRSIQHTPRAVNDPFHHTLCRCVRPIAIPDSLRHARNS